MPRPQRPRPDRFIHIRADNTLDALAGLYEGDEEFRRLKRDVRRLIDAYLKAWTPGAAPGRRDETRRNALFVALAEAFQTRSGWRSPGDRRDYRLHLVEFLARVLTADGIFLPGATRVLRLIPPHLRVPR